MWPFRTTKAIVDQTALKNASFIYGIGGARWLERRFDLLAKEGYEENPIVFSCVSKLARAVASVDLQVYTKKGSKITKVETHPMLDLLSHPNPTMGGRKFLESIVTSKLIGGNAYILGQGIDPNGKKTQKPTELWLLPTQAMQVKAQARSFLPEAYEYKPAKGDPIVYPVNQLTGKSAVLHLKTVNPLNPSIGLPPLVAAAFGVDTFNSGQAWNKALLDNEARPSGALEVVNTDGSPASLTEEQRNGLREQLDQSSGKGKAGRPLLLEGGMKWTAMSLSPKDMDHRETMLTTARFIAGVFHTPPQLVNIPGESTYSNYAEAKLAYYSDTVLPFLESLLEDINNWLPSFYGDDSLYIWYDEDMITALEPRRKEKADRINVAVYMTTNEKRRAMGLPDIHGGDTVLINATQIPLDLVDESVRLNEPGSPTDQQNAN